LQSCGTQAGGGLVIADFLQTSCAGWLLHEHGSILLQAWNGGTMVSPCCSACPSHLAPASRQASLSACLMAGARGCTHDAWLGLAWQHCTRHHCMPPRGRRQEAAWAGHGVGTTHPPPCAGKPTPPPCSTPPARALRPLPASTCPHLLPASFPPPHYLHALSGNLVQWT